MTEQFGSKAASSIARPLVNRYKPVRLALIAYAIGEAGLAVFSASEVYLRVQEGIDPFMDEGTIGLTVGLGFLFFGALQLISLIVSIVLVCMWTYRAMKNLHLHGSPEASTSPGWAVGWYFIPFANIVKPFGALLEIWRGSRALAGQTIKVPAYVGWWWATWLLSNFLANIALRMTGFMEEGPAYDAGTAISSAGSVVSVICALLLLRVTREITEAQQVAGPVGAAEVFA